MSWSCYNRWQRKDKSHKYKQHLLTSVHSSFLSLLLTAQPVFCIPPQKKTKKHVGISLILEPSQAWWCTRAVAWPLTPDSGSSLQGTITKFLTNETSSGVPCYSQRVKPWWHYSHTDMILLWQRGEGRWWGGRGIFASLRCVIENTRGRRQEKIITLFFGFKTGRASWSN